MVFDATLGRTSANAGIFLLGGGGLRKIARAGSPLGGGTAVAFGTPANVGHAEAAFVGEVRGGTSSFALVLKGVRGGKTLAASGKDTRTRVKGRYKAIDPPTGGNGDVLFRATLAQAGMEGLFLTRGRTTVAVVASGDDGPHGGVFHTFASPALASGTVVFLATVGGAVTEHGLYRVTEPAKGSIPDAAPAAEPIVLAADASPLGGTFQEFGPPAVGTRGDLAFSADLLDGNAPGGVFYARDTQRNFP
jgi:hypothetical protein